MKKRIISLLMAIMIFMSSSIFYYDVDATVTIGGLTIDSITFRKVHSGYEISGSFIEIWGSGLVGSNILFEHSVHGFLGDMGEREIDTDGLVRYTFTKDERQIALEWT